MYPGVDRPDSDVVRARLGARPGPSRSQSVSAAAAIPARPRRRCFLPPQWPVPIRILHADGCKNQRKHSDTAAFFLPPELETSSECSFCESSNAGQAEATLSHPRDTAIPCFPPITDIATAAAVAHVAGRAVPLAGPFHTVRIGRFCALPATARPTVMSPSFSLFATRRGVATYTLSHVAMSWFTGAAILTWAW